ncbi:hypothetical protein KSP40_PGU004432 [Platanthera guangdongensis]|uniref:Uncharacterized protein n=1 Tax=Platanthera guangdongensis TaxID=2320717 RepID=A0ABR2LR76_9ASPA
MEFGGALLALVLQPKDAEVTPPRKIYVRGRSTFFFRDRCFDKRFSRRISRRSPPEKEARREGAEIRGDSEHDFGVREHHDG